MQNHIYNANDISNRSQNKRYGSQLFVQFNALVLFVDQRNVKEQRIQWYCNHTRHSKYYPPLWKDSVMLLMRWATWYFQWITSISHGLLTSSFISMPQVIRLKTLNPENIYIYIYIYNIKLLSETYTMYGKSRTGKTRMKQYNKYQDHNDIIPLRTNQVTSKTLHNYLYD